MIVYTVKQTNNAHWIVRRMGATLCDDVERELALQQARDLARDEYIHSGQPTCIELRETSGRQDVERFSHSLERRAVARRFGDQRTSESRFLRWQW